MTAPPLAREPVRPAQRRPTRAVLQYAVSRAVIVGLLTVTVIVVWDAVRFRDGGTAPGALRPVLVPRTDAATDGGALLGATLREVDRALRGASGSLVSLVAGRPDGRTTPLVLEVDVGTGARGISDVLDALRSAGVADPIPRRVTPTPVGVRASIHASTVLSVARLDVADRDGRALAVRLAEDVERAGLVLRHLEVTEGDERTVRVEVEGATEALVGTVMDIERRHASPARIVALELRALDDGRNRMSIVFRPRDLVGS